MTTEQLLPIETSFALTGLGVLVRRPEPKPGRLGQFGLHAALHVKLLLTDGTEVAIVASVEEVTRPAPTDTSLATTEYALLLQLTEPLPVPAGTEVWLSEQPADDDWLL